QELANPRSEVQPFEFTVLEMALRESFIQKEDRYTRLSALIATALKARAAADTQRLSVRDFLAPSLTRATREHALYKLLMLSNSLAALEVDVKRHESCLENLLKSDEDMAAMYLSYRRDSGNERKVSDHEDVELMLESFGMQLEDLSDRIQKLQESTGVVTQSKMEQLMLTSERNRIMMGMATSSLAVSTLMAGFFGMNLVSGLEDVPGLFWLALGGCTALSVFLFYGLMAGVRRYHSVQRQQLSEVSSLRTALDALDEAYFELRKPSSLSSSEEEPQSGFTRQALFQTLESAGYALNNVEQGSMLSFKAMACLAFGASPALAIRAVAQPSISLEEDCWDSLSPPDNLGTLSAIMTKNLGQQCRSEVQGLLGDLYEECTKIEGSSEKDCLKELFWWFFGYTGAGYRAGWYQKLAATPREAMLWAGFYDGSPLGLTQKALQSFSNMVDTSIVHPSSILGKIVQRNHDLLGCRGDIGAWRPCCCVKGTVSAIDKGPVAGFWSGASRFFVHGMASNNQSSVVAVLNKVLDEDKKWSLQKSVFWKYELPQLAFEIAEPLDFRPQLLLVDMRGTCEYMTMLVMRRLARYDHRAAKVWLTSKPIICLDCLQGLCDLDETLATRVRSCLGKDLPSCPRFEFCEV
ncbi:mrs2, partial [Symbiodinium sp. KB8]